MVIFPFHPSVVFPHLHVAVSRLLHATTSISSAASSACCSSCSPCCQWSSLAHTATSWRTIPNGEPLAPRGGCVTCGFHIVEHGDSRHKKKCDLLILMRLS